MGLLDLLLPERCAGCRAEGHAFCRACRGSLVRLAAPLCAACGAPAAWPVARCRECAGRLLGFERARAAVAYEGPAVGLVGAWKHGGRRSLSGIAAALVLEALARPEADLLAFVPAVAGRALWRGGNPAERLALELGAAWGLPVHPLLARRAAPRPQRGLAPPARRRNVAGAFTAAAAPGAIVLVDDVYTTGATVGEAARALRLGGARRVEVVTFARALRR